MTNSVIYKTSDRIELKVGDIKIKISPLSLHHKTILHGWFNKAAPKVEGEQGDIEMLLKGSFYALKYGLKSLTGFKQPDGSEYSLEFDTDGTLTDNCVDDLLNLKQSSELIACCSLLVGGIPDKSQLPKGVSFASEDKPSPNGKKSKA